jgi:hypothetical protein
MAQLCLFRSMRRLGFGGCSRLTREELREVAAAVKVDRSHDGEVDRVGLRPCVGPGASGAMASDGVGAKLPFRTVVCALQSWVRDERHQLPQVPHDSALEPCDARVLRLRELL